MIVREYEHEPPRCDSCDGILGHPANGGWTCARCKLDALRKGRKERIRKDEFDAGNPEHFRLQSRGGAWRYYRKLASPADLRRQATEICRRQPGYGTSSYRGDPYEAVALQQQAERLERC